MSTTTDFLARWKKALDEANEANPPLVIVTSTRVVGEPMPKPRTFLIDWTALKP